MTENNLYLNDASINYRNKGRGVLFTSPINTYKFNNLKTNEDKKKYSNYSK